MCLQKYLKTSRLAYLKFLLQSLKKKKSRPQRKKSRLKSETLSKVSCVSAVICGIHYWSQNMTFLEASQCGGICATASPADCRGRHTPLAFYKTASLSPCRPLHSALIVCQEASDGKHTMQTIHCWPRAMHFAVTLNYTVQIAKAKEQRYAQSKQTSCTVVG